MKRRGKKERDENAESVEVAEGKMTKKNYTGRLFLNTFTLSINLCFELNSFCRLAFPLTDTAIYATPSRLDYGKKTISCGAVNLLPISDA